MEIWSSLFRHSTSAHALAIFANKMRVSVQGFWAAKSGNKNSEYEDDFWPHNRMISKEDKIFRFAVADGATETSFSGILAKQLVRSFCKGLFDGPEFAEHMR